MSEAYIVDIVRTAGARRGGRLANWHPVDLAAGVINAIIRRTEMDPSTVDDVVMGCVSQAGEQSNDVARNAVLASMLPETVPGVSLDRQCGSSQQAVHFAAQAVMSGTMDIVLAGGVESMSRVPMLSPSSLFQKAGMGYYQSPGINRKYDNFLFSQFAGAEMMPKKYQLTKDQLDNFALLSHQRAAAAVKGNAFKDEIVPLPLRDVDGVETEELHVQDEGIRFDATLDGIKSLKPLQEDGFVTAGNASQVCDGASVALIANEAGLKKLGLAPVARIHHMTVLGSDPIIMLDGPIAATRLALKRAGMSMADIDLYEVNEAFASVPLAWLKELDADHNRLNVNGGAIALGHPLGATGTKLMATLINVLKARGKRYGLQTMCEGGGQANVTIVERL